MDSIRRREAEIAEQKHGKHASGATQALELAIQQKKSSLDFPQGNCYDY
jgi:hypothetical protein